MSENTANTPNGGSRKEMGVKKVSEEEINKHIAGFTKNPETTIVVRSIDTAVLKNMKLVEEGSSGSSGDNQYIDFGAEGKKLLEDLSQEQGLIISTQPIVKKKKGKTDREEDTDREDNDSKGRDIED